MKNNSKLKAIAIKYFEEHPEAKKLVIQKNTLKADEQQKELASSSTKDWLSKDKIPFVKEVLLKEERLYYSALKRGEKILKKLGFERSLTLLDTSYVLSKYPKLTGESLCKLHHTYGLDPLDVADILNVADLPNILHDGYLAAYEKHKQTGRAGFKPKVIKVKEPF